VPRASAASQPAAPPLLARSHHAASFSDRWRRLSAASSACLGRRRGALFARAASTSDDSREKEEDAEEDVDIIDEDDVDAWLDDDDDDDDDFDASAMPFLVASGSEDDDDDEPIRVDVSVVDGDGDGDGDGDDAAPPLTTGDDEIDIATLRDAVRSDAKKLVEWILRPPPGTPLPRDLYSPTTTRAELSVALCGDAYIRALNNEWRGKDVATDVLSFPQDAFGDFVVFGDVVISVDAARRQAAAMRHSTRREARVLLTHGFVHLLGYDHEEGEEEAREMAALEDALLKMLDDDDDGGGGGGGGLISTSLSGARGGSSASSSDAKDVRTFTPSASGKSTRTADTLVLDLDGTLLNKECLVTAAVAEALLEASAAGVDVFIATGKARPAAMRAAATALTHGVDLSSFLVGPRTPGVFLQGLDVYGRGGGALYRAKMPEDVVREAFAMVYGGGGGGKKTNPADVALTAFAADACATLRSHALLDELSALYHEPVSEERDDVDALLASVGAGGVQKLLLMASSSAAIDAARPAWEKAFGPPRAEVTQAVSNMLEILPLGNDKARGVATLLAHLGADPARTVAVGDGENDLGMLRLAGCGVAMGNAGDAVKRAADHVLERGNEEDGVAEAVQRFVL